MNAKESLKRIGRPCLTCFSAVLIACTWFAEVRGAPPVRVETERDAPTTADFPELADAYAPVGKFVAANVILVGERDRSNAPAAGQSFAPLPDKAHVTAFEENDHFICATGDAPPVTRTSRDSQDKPARPAVVRRFLFLKPSVFVMDDVVMDATSDSSWRWQLHGRGESQVTGRQVRITDSDQQLVCETLWPAEGAFRQTASSPEAGQSVCEIAMASKADATAARCLHVFHLRRADDAEVVAKPVLETNAGRFHLTVSTSDRVFRLDLPPPGTDAGSIAVEAADGKAIIPRRPLPAGVLPHGREGTRLIERWDRAYRGGRRPAWDTGVTANDLKQAVETRAIKPCRTAVLGCGSGTNAIYLAGKGFDVTAIDIAPTALGIAAGKADKADVQVRWMLADVLALPEMEPFDFVFDRGCYHNVRYVDAAAFVENVRRISRPGTRVLVLSLNRDGPPGVREQHMREDFSELFEFEWLRDSGIRTGPDAQTRRQSWSLMLRRKQTP
jgi:SAM-dependent methyltransferase